MQLLCTFVGPYIEQSNLLINRFDMKLKRMFVAALMMFSMTAMVAQEMPPIPVDPAVRIGKLDNGLTYYIRHNEYPEHVANFYIAQRVGSINEDESQRGLAHFLEHMAFNGSEHFKGNGIIEFTRSLGVEFGSDLNAYTSIDQTVYRVCDVPTKRATALDSCLLILKDWSNGLLLEADEIDKERDVVHNEWRLGEGPSQRMLQRALPKIYPGSKYGVRLPIGLMSVIDSFKPQTLRAYYHRWYRPDSQAIIVVGDVDVDHMEAKIKELFAGIKVDPNAPKVVPEAVPDNKEAIYVYEKDLEFERASVKKEKDVELFTKKVKDSYQNLLNDSFKMLDDNQIRRIALMFGSYRRVLVFGTGSSGYVAQEFQLRFMRIGMDVAAVTDSQMIRMSAALAGTDTLVVAISLSGRTGDILESIRIAKRGGAAVIFITSNTETEECSLCDEVVKAASIENLDEGTKISPQFPLLVLIDVLYSYYFANDFYFKAQKYKDTLIAIKGTEGAEEKKGE